jgi:hypothetical protein
LDPEAYSVLSLIWCASDYVVGHTINGTTVGANIPTPLSSYALAVKLSEHPSHVAKLNTRIRGIGIAAAAYDLIQRVEVHKTLVVLRGTILLHEFMISIASADMASFARFSLTPGLPLASKNRAG